uniref:Uncharacterized protein n=1 Tax=Amorphochlora amoebiformis TaxID=1561963 RepID=A0A7S0H7C4_9EUKA|mmetsp:Transcript_9567/g.15153  ORF Transcript_9567/g.15153 Transcript_9567/m.15153 type:complete len:154 (+) Transcript_9567:97-558(+)
MSGEGGSRVRVLHDSDRILCLQHWIKVAKHPEASALPGSTEVMKEMLWWNEGAIGANKRRFSLAVIQDGDGVVDAIVSLLLTPDNSDFMSFLQQNYVLTVNYIAISPTGSADIGVGTRLIQAVKSLAQEKQWRVEWEPLRSLYGGRFYLASSV